MANRPVLVYEDGEGGYVDEFGYPVYDDGTGGFIDEAGRSVLVADPDDPTNVSSYEAAPDAGAAYLDDGFDPRAGAGSGEVAVFENADGTYEDEFGYEVFDDGNGSWVYADGTALASAPSTGVGDQFRGLESGSAQLNRSAGRRRGEWDDLASGDGCGRRALIGVVIVLATLGIIAGGFAWYISRQISPGGEPGDVVEVLTVEPGWSRSDVASELEEQGIISSASVFSWFLRINGGLEPVKSGEYGGFHKNMSFYDAIAELNAGPIPIESVEVRIPEGSTIYELFDLLAEKFPQYTAQEFQTALDSGQVTNKYLPDPPPQLPAGFTAWEGLLFPDTYQLLKSATPAEILQEFSDTMVENLDKIGYENATTRTGYSAYDVIKVASLAEKEAGRPAEERPRVAQVIYNRLSSTSGEFGDPPKLIFATSVCYGLKRSCVDMGASALEDASNPWNLHVHPGLPPTPICLPSRAALEAALAPETGDWTYFVKDKNDQTRHIFLSDYEEFERLVEEALELGIRP